MNNESIYCNTKKDIPLKDHFVILHFSSISIPGDERSRTNPGHGYPASTENIIRYEAFLNESVWKEEVTKLILKNKPDEWTAFKIIIPFISTSIDVTINMNNN